MAGIFRQRRSRGYQHEVWGGRWERRPEDGKLVIAGGIVKNEVDTYTCLACQQVIEKPPFMQATDEAIGAWSYSLNGPICIRCHRNGAGNGHLTYSDFCAKVNEEVRRRTQREKWQ